MSFPLPTKSVKTIKENLRKLCVIQYNKYHFFICHQTHDRRGVGPFVSSLITVPEIKHMKQQRNDTLRFGGILSFVVWSKVWSRSTSRASWRFFSSRNSSSRPSTSAR